MTARPPRVWLCDVEGTVAPLSLVSEQLFPYARKHLRGFLNAHLEEQAVQEDLSLLRAEYGVEAAPGAPSFGGEMANVEQAITYLVWLMENDRKSTALKSLQGRIWKSGFESGELKGTLFPDVPEAFARWAARGRVAIYSSGSVEAQRLVFRYSSYGDLTARVSAYYDTRTGAKGDRASYAAIAASLAVVPAEILFFSDGLRELDAARSAGCQTCLMQRPGNPAPVGDHGHPIASSFTAIA